MIHRLLLTLILGLAFAPAGTASADHNVHHDPPGQCSPTDPDAGEADCADHDNGSGNDEDCEDDNNGQGVPGHCADPDPDPEPDPGPRPPAEVSEVTTVSADCDATVTTTTTTTTGYVLSADGATWVPGEPVVEVTELVAAPVEGCTGPPLIDHGPDVVAQPGPGPQAHPDVAPGPATPPLPEVPTFVDSGA